ncbi:MAG: zinc-binding dehydrogenase [Bacteroidota bacterium]
MINIDENRLKMSKNFGVTDVNTTKEDAVKKIQSENKDGDDVGIEVVGVPEIFDICQKIFRPCRHVPIVGVYGKTMVFQIQDLWIKNITLTTGLVNTNTIPMLFKKRYHQWKLKPVQLITYHFKLENMLEAYKVLAILEKKGF